MYVIFRPGYGYATPVGKCKPYSTDIAKAATFSDLDTAVGKCVFEDERAIPDPRENDPPVGEPHTISDESPRWPALDVDPAVRPIVGKENGDAIAHRRIIRALCDLAVTLQDRKAYMDRQWKDCRYPEPTRAYNSGYSAACDDIMAKLDQIIAQRS